MAKKKTPSCGYSDCKYIGKLGSDPMCNYYGINGRLRGCKPTPDCNKYEKGRRIRKSYALRISEAQPYYDSWR